MPVDQTAKSSARIKLIAAIAVWGGSFIATKVALQDASPSTIVVLRFFMGALILGWFAWRRGEWALGSFRDALELLGLGFLGITLHQWLQSTGLVTSQAFSTAWIVSTTPVFMALLGWLFLGERPGWLTAGGILLAAAGVLLVVSRGDLAGIFRGGVGAPGDVLILVSAPVWAAFSVFSRPVLHRFSPLKLTFYIILFGWLLSVIPFLAGGYWVEVARIGMTGWIAILYLGILCSALAYIFYNDGLQAFSASQVGAFLYLEPLVATLIAAWMLQEHISFLSILGGLLILLGVWLVNLGK